MSKESRGGGGKEGTYRFEISRLFAKMIAHAIGTAATFIERPVIAVLRRLLISRLARKSRANDESCYDVVAEINNGTSLAQLNTLDSCIMHYLQFRDAQVIADDGS